MTKSEGLLAGEKEALNRAFARMRKAGLMGRQNHCCCGSCSAAKISADLEDMPAERRAKVRGAAHYDRQDAESMWTTRHLYVAFGPESPGETYESIAAEVVKAVREEGLWADWDGDKFHCVEVFFTGASSLVPHEHPSRDWAIKAETERRAAETGREPWSIRHTG